MNNKKIFIILIFIFFISKNIYCQDNAKVYVIKKLEFQEINRWYAAYIKKAIKKASDEGASLIILELDTPGGLLSSALSIKNKNDYIDKLIVLNSASKTFNLASLLNSHVIIPNEEIRKIYKKFVSKVNRTEFNLLGLIATESAYKYGSDWLDGLLKTIKRNYEYIRCEFLNKVPEIIISPLEGTYLPFFDLRNMVSKDRVKEFIQDDCKIAIDFGEWFGKNFKGFIRVNIATDFKYIEYFVDKTIKQLKNKSYK